MMAGRCLEALIVGLQRDLGHLDAVARAACGVQPARMPALVGQGDLRVHHVQVAACRVAGPVVRGRYRPRGAEC